jgi:DNA replication and repair protein RecF
MRVTSLALEDFRSYTQREVAFAPGTTAFIGPNGAGKTNILEAVHVVARGDSSRANDDAEMIRWGSAFSRIGIEIERAGEHARLDVTLFAPTAGARRRPRRYTTDGAPRRADDVIGAFTVVAFFPEDTELLASAPSARRRYLDAMVAQVDRGHRADTRAFARVLQQRNALLRTGALEEQLIPESELAFWDSELARLSAAISFRRQVAVHQMRSAFRDAAGELGADPVPDVAYAGQVRGETEDERADLYRRLILEKRDRERWQGTTLVGPHRDDLAVAADERPLPTFASRGEQRSAVLALKLAEARWIEQRTGELPIFLLDDVLSELDSSRRESLCRALPDGAQALLTAAVPASIPESLRARAAIVPIEREPRA